ncbi:MAG: NAD(P)H-dependent oxidoreductase [Erythrobacter sp.]|uniref:NADPH-dependent FMN reductase n=1 Tax=Erythrobacter sp. TaxID=1042 RepID=UPI00263A0067|nr:NAD(P)H-dependent oxidoreductase [Erythrobacter sp.]MDJ0979743.1 NAD(P)H-dependent oxidoreductase [Erythrobacter sp.]
MRLLAFAASNSSKSINRKLVTYAASMVDFAEVETLDIHDYEMPLYRLDREEESGVPQQAHDFLARVGAVDAILVSFAENNKTYSAAFKNLFDWCSRARDDVWQGKKMALLATSPGRAGADQVLGFAVRWAPRFGGEVVGHLSVPSFNHTFDAEAGRLIDEELDAQLRALVAKLSA